MPWGHDDFKLAAFQGVFGSEKVASAPGTIYFGLSREATDPDTVLGTEPDTTGGYARVAMSNVDGEWTFTADGGSNTNEIRWPVATGTYSITDPLNQWVCYDNSTGGNLIMFGELTTTITVTGSGDQPVIPATDLTVAVLD